MAISPTDLFSILNELIQTCKDGQEGFLTAAENVSDTTLREIFNRYSQQRAKFAGELQNEMHALGDANPEQSSSLAGTLHRGWINIKSAIANRDSHTILQECERGEDAAVAHYRDVLGEELPANIRAIVQRQFAEIFAAYEQVKQLRNGTKPA